MGQVLLYSHQELVQNVPISVNYHLSDFVWSFHSSYQPVLKSKIQTLGVLNFGFCLLSNSKVGKLEFWPAEVFSFAHQFRCISWNFWDQFPSMTVWVCMFFFCKHFYTGNHDLHVAPNLMQRIRLMTILFIIDSRHSLSHQSCSLTWEFFHAHQCALNITHEGGIYCKKKLIFAQKSTSVTF